MGVPKMTSAEALQWQRQQAASPPPLKGEVNNDEDFGTNFSTAYQNAIKPYYAGAAPQTLPSGHPASGFPAMLGNIAGTITRDAPGAILGGIAGSVPGAVLGAAVNEGGTSVAHDVNIRGRQGLETNPLKDPGAAVSYVSDFSLPVATALIPGLRGANLAQTVIRNALAQGAAGAASGSIQRATHGQPTTAQDVGGDFLSGAAFGGGGAAAAHLGVPLLNNLFKNSADSQIERQLLGGGVGEPGQVGPAGAGSENPYPLVMNGEPPIVQQWREDTGHVYTMLQHLPTAKATQDAVQTYSETYGMSPLQGAQLLQQETQQRMQHLQQQFAQNLKLPGLGDTPTPAADQAAQQLPQWQNQQNQMQQYMVGKGISAPQQGPPPPTDFTGTDQTIQGAQSQAAAQQAQLQQAQAQGQYPAGSPLVFHRAIQTLAQDTGLQPDEIYQWLQEKEAQNGMLSDAIQQMQARQLENQQAMGYQGQGAPNTPAADAAAAQSQQQAMGYQSQGAPATPISDAARLQMQADANRQIQGLLKGYVSNTEPLVAPPK